MSSPKEIIEHLFRHHNGRMLAVLVRIFGLEHMEMLEDAIQDSFVKAYQSWKNGIPPNPEAWLIKVARNRTIDLLRKQSKIKGEQYLTHGSMSYTIDHLFQNENIADAQLSMIFAACHPLLDPRDQIVFALKTISGLNRKEIASALLLKEENVKKRITRAKKRIIDEEILFEIPDAYQIADRLGMVMNVLYLLFMEGFHSASRQKIVRQELCAEAWRLIQLVNEHTEISNGHTIALEALFCLLSVRLPSKINEDGTLVTLKDQDRSLWSMPMMQKGSLLMNRALEENEVGIYHYEAAIAAEHCKAIDFKSTDWSSIATFYDKMEDLAPSGYYQLNRAMILIQLNKAEEALHLLLPLDLSYLNSRIYLYHATLAEAYCAIDDDLNAKKAFQCAAELVQNDIERSYFEKRINML